MNLCVKGIFLFSVVVSQGCMSEKITDISDVKPYSGIIGRKDSLSSREYYLYSDNGRGFFIDGAVIYQTGVRKVCTLPRDTEVVIEQVLREEITEGDVSMIEMVPVVSVVLPKKKTKILAKTSFAFLKRFEGFYSRPRLLLRPATDANKAP